MGKRLLVELTAPLLDAVRVSRKVRILEIKSINWHGLGVCRMKHYSRRIPIGDSKDL